MSKFYFTSFLYGTARNLVYNTIYVVMACFLSSPCFSGKTQNVHVKYSAKVFYYVIYQVEKLSFFYHLQINLKENGYWILHCFFEITKLILWNLFINSLPPLSSLYTYVKYFDHSSSFYLFLFHLPPSDSLCLPS
jgi:hypothetical protein